MNLRKNILYILIIIMLFISGCGAENQDGTKTDADGSEKIAVAVSIVPQETFVKAVAGDLVEVITMVPPGNSPSNYQPTPKQMSKFSESEIYFSIGVPTEEANILPRIKDLNRDIKIVSLDDKVSEVYPHRFFQGQEGKGNKDPHIWLSPKRVKIMVETIKEELILLDPDNREIYEENALKYISELDEIDNEIKEALKEHKGQSFIIYHPAFGYFADDYGLKMLAIEDHGKKATALKVQEVIEFAKREDIKFVFYQEEFDSGQAETISDEIEGEAIKVAPLAPNYIENLLHIANKFKDTLK